MGLRRYCPPSGAAVSPEAEDWHSPEHPRILHVFVSVFDESGISMRVNHLYHSTRNIPTLTCNLALDKHIVCVNLAAGSCGVQQ